MSLLLDALKKAADEKEKLKASETESSNLEDKSNPQAEEAEDMDLDLDMQKSVEPVLEIDEELLVFKEAEEKQAEEIKSESNQETENLEQKIDAGGPLEAESVVENKIAELKIEKEPKPKTYPVQNKEALSELINKSNEHTRKSKRKTSLIIASIISLIFLMVAAYLYFEFSSNSQNIFIADNNAVIKRNKPVTNLNIKLENTSDIKNKAIVPAPVVKEAAVEKPVIKHLKKIVKQRPEPVKAAPIKVIYKTVKDPIEALIQNAYFAFKEGDYARSKNLYEKANKSDPKNRDILLGLAAIAVKQQRYEYARQKYLQLRHLNPKDSIATAGLSAIKNKSKSQLGESELKFMLQEQADAAHLYFALGAIYSSQQSWPKAQAAFFSAWSGENSNADYAFNLAVSLDNLGKKKQAMKFYKLSLKFFKKNQVNFSRQTVEKRISTLNEYNNRNNR